MAHNADTECPDCGETDRIAGRTECPNCGHTFPEPPTRFLTREEIQIGTDALVYALGLTEAQARRYAELVLLAVTEHPLPRPADRA